MTRLGADATSTSVSTLRSLEATFVCRYLSPSFNTWKNLTWAEAQTLQAAGIDIVSNWEYGTNDYAGGYSQGQNYARQAEALHLACGGPAGAPIYFSVDTDVSPSAADSYFQGINSVLGVARTGVYGSTGLLRHLKSAGLVAWSWRTMSTDWNGGSGNTGEFNITQTGYFNSNYDRDVAYTTDFGQWSAHGATPIPTPTPVPSVDYQNRASHNTYTPVTVDGSLGPQTFKALQFVIGADVDGVFGSNSIVALQAMLNNYHGTTLIADGVLGPVTVKADHHCSTGSPEPGNFLGRKLNKT
jgi:hypothetical protein